MKTTLVKLLSVGLVFVTVGCKTTRLSLTSPMTMSPSTLSAAHDSHEPELETAVVGLVRQDQVVPAVFSTGDVLESNPGTTLIASQGITDSLNVRTTAYCHKETDSLPYGTKCADGSELKFGDVRSAAADWSRYPVGTRFKIKGLPYEYVVDDYGSALVGTDTIDLYKPTFSQMNQWGAREVPIEVIEWGCYEKSREILSGRLHKTEAHHVREMHNAIIEKRLSKKVPRMALPENQVATPPVVVGGRTSA